MLSALLVWGLNNWRWVLPALIMGLMLGAIGYLNWRLEYVKKEAREYRESAELREKALGETISIQNRAVEALETESRNRIAKAQKGLQEASRASQGARNEAARLRALASVNAPSAAVGGLCPAADAVHEVRRGLSQ